MPSISINALNGFAKTLVENVCDYSSAGLEGNINSANIIIKPRSKKAPNSTASGSSSYDKGGSDFYVIPRGWYILNSIVTDNLRNFFNSGVMVNIPFKVFGSNEIYKAIKISSKQVIYIDSDNNEEIILINPNGSTGYYNIYNQDAAFKLGIYVIKDCYLTQNDYTAGQLYLKYIFRVKDNLEDVFDDYYGKYDYFFKKFDMPKPGDILNIGYNSSWSWYDGSTDRTAEEGSGTFNRSLCVVLESNNPNAELKIVPLYEKTNAYDSSFTEISGNINVGWEGNLPSTISNIPEWIPLMFRNFHIYMYQGGKNEINLMKSFYKYPRQWNIFTEENNSLSYNFQKGNFGPKKPSSLSKIEGYVLPLTIEDLISFFKVVSTSCLFDGNRQLSFDAIFHWIQLYERTMSPEYSLFMQNIGFSYNSLILDTDGDFTESESENIIGSVLNIPTISINFPLIVWYKQMREATMSQYTSYNGAYIDYEIIHEDIKWVNSQDGEEIV